MNDLKERLNLMSIENTFGNFKPNNNSLKAFEIYKEMADNPTWYMLLCYGKTGCGKTHLCEALAVELSKKYIFARVFEWAEQVRAFKKAMRSEIKGQYDMMFENFRKIPFMIIDDVGMGSVGSAWEWGEIEDIVNYRYRNQLPTVITTNLDASSLPDRVVSRFKDKLTSRIVFNGAEDYRPKKGVK